MEPSEFVPPSTPSAEDERLDLARAQQKIIADVFREFRGAADVPQIRAALVDAFLAAGLEPPPAPWIDAVAFDTSEDRLYTVSPGLDIPSDLLDDAADGSTNPPA